MTEVPGGVETAEDNALPSSLIIIPARDGSTRFPGKPLAMLRGRDGASRPLIEWVWRAACAAAPPASVVVATDTARIADCVSGLGGQAVMTSANARNGTERCAEAYTLLGRKVDVVLNLQGDSPLVPPAHIAAVAAAFTDPEVCVATPYVLCDDAMSRTLRDHYAAGRIGGTCVTLREDGCALYFSKAPIPHGAQSLRLHIGLYGYRPQALLDYARSGPTPLELAEGLEQLRYLEAGQQVRMVEVHQPPGGIWEVNNPEDVPLVEARLG